MVYISKSATSKSIHNLVEKGYLRKEEDVEDRRATRIYLTDRRNKIKELLKELDRKAENKMLEGFGDEEKYRLRQYLERILENLDSERGNENIIWFIIDMVIIFVAMLFFITDVNKQGFSQKIF